MKTTLSILALALAFAGPALAQETKMDVSKMTCKEMAAMDKAGMMSTAMAVREAAKSGGMAMMDMSDEDLVKAIGDKCKGNDGMMIMDAMPKKM